MKTITPAKTLVDQVYEMVLDAICDGTLASGERLTQEEIAARLNVSRQPVMHALIRLRTEGFLTEAGRKGVQVKPLDEDFLRAIYQFRLAIDPMAVALAIPLMTEEDAEELRRIVLDGKRAASEKNKREVLHADAAFHQRIYELSRNPVIVSSMRLNWQHLRAGMGQILQDPSLSLKVWKEHDQILDLMLEKKTKQAVKAIQDHLINACERKGLGTLKPV